MEWVHNIELVDDETIKIIDNDFNLSPWVYSVKLGSKWHSVFIDSPIIKFRRYIKYYFDEVDRQHPIIDTITGEEIPKKYTCIIALDLYEYKKLQKIDKLIPGCVIAPITPEDNSRLEHLEKEILQKQKQILLLSSKMDNLENLIKRSLGL
jgi:hypothetical protein